MTKITEHPTLQGEAIARFWENQARTAPVRLLDETNHPAGGSLAAEIEGRFLIWEAWGTLDGKLLETTMDAIRQACVDTPGQERPALFMDLTRVDEIDETAREKIIGLRAELEGPNGLSRAAAVFGDTMPRIMYDMAGVLRPAPWEEHVFPSVEEALIWLERPHHTGLLDVDGLSWVVTMAD